MATKTALNPVLAMYNTDIPGRDNPVSSMMESMNIENTYDWPGPLLKTTKPAAPTTNQP